MNQETLKQAPAVIESTEDDMRELALDEVEEITGASGFERAVLAL